MPCGAECAPYCSTTTCTVRVVVLYGPQYSNVRAVGSAFLLYCTVLYSENMPAADARSSRTWSPHSFLAGSIAGAAGTFVGHVRATSLEP